MAAEGPAPLISLVLAVRGVEEWLGECLDSILAAPGPDIEVIAVDDASPDRCGQILDARADGDPRLAVIHLGESAGPGPARAAGLARARGDHIWFVDPDDLLAPGALESVAARLARDRPDVLLVDYRILGPDGRTAPSPGRDLLSSPDAGAGAPGDGGATLTLAQRPQLIDRTMTSWSKVFRREFLAGLPVTFPPGIHEDVPVTAAALLLARRIGVLDDVCYLYRRRERSFLATTGMGHFAIFAAYESVFALLDTVPAAPGAPGVTPAVRAAVFGRAMEHATTILASGLVPRGARRDFFRRLAAEYRRRRPAGYTPPPGPRGLKIRIVGWNAYPAYLLLAPANRARVGLRGAIRRARRAGR